LSGIRRGGGGGTWADGDTIYFVSENPGGLSRVAAAGGQFDEIAKFDFANGERVYKFPSALPGGKAILFTVATVDAESFDDAHIAVFVTATGQKKILVDGFSRSPVELSLLLSPDSRFHQSDCRARLLSIAQEKDDAVAQNFFVYLQNARRRSRRRDAIGTRDASLIVPAWEAASTVRPHPKCRGMWSNS